MTYLQATCTQLGGACLRRPSSEYTLTLRGGKTRVVNITKFLLKVSQVFHQYRQAMYVNAASWSRFVAIGRRLYPYADTY